jgi:hypothetical protein
MDKLSSSVRDNGINEWSLIVYWPHPPVSVGGIYVIHGGAVCLLSTTRRRFQL